MQVFTISIKHPEGGSSVTNHTFSQVVEMLEGVSRENARKFFAGKENAKGKYEKQPFWHVTLLSVQN